MNPTVHTLSNGARLILARDPNLRTVAVVPGIHIGSRFEDKVQNGLSHFVEHLMFKGTTKYPTAEGLSRAIDRLGGHINASTDREITNIQVRTATAYERTCADIAMELLTAPLFRDEDIERERPVVIDEIKMYEADDQTRAWDLSQAAVFGEHSLGWPIAGYAENIEKVTADEVRSFRNGTYVPGNVTVTLAGNYSDRVEEFVRERLLAMQAAYVRTSPRVSPTYAEGSATFTKESFTPRATLFLNFSGPTMQALRPTDAYSSETEKALRARTALDLLGNILGGYMSSRLFVELREKLSLCYSVGSAFNPLSDASTMIAYMTLEPEHLTKAVAALGKELRRVLVDLNDEELSSAKSHIGGSMVIAGESCLRMATDLTHDLIVHERVETTEEKIARYNSITLDEVREAAKLYLKNVRTAIVAPAETLKGIEDVCANELSASVNG